MNNLLKRISLIIGIVAISFCVFGQKVTKIRGKVYDAQTGEAMPFVDVGLKGTSIGVSTDLDGYYNIETRFASEIVFASFIGYETMEVPITLYEVNRIDFKLENQTLQIETVEIREKKTKYSKKNNPALNLARKVLDNAHINSLKGKDYYSYNQQEKIKVDINNITDEFKNTRFVRKFEFLWDYIDTSEINGKTYLPFFMRENLSSIHYKKDGDILKEKRIASRYSEIEKSLDANTINDALDLLYQDIEIYEPKIEILAHQFVSPLAKAGDDFYRYYIIDTTTVNDKEAINLAFIPAVKGNFGFLGNIYVSNDGKFTVLKVDMGIVEGINLNFVRDLRIIQEFEALGDDFVKVKDEVVIDYAIAQNGVGFYGSRTLFFSDFNFEKPEDESIFGHLEKIIYEEGSQERSEEYWEENRFTPLNENDRELYEMVDTLKNDKYYKRYAYFIKTMITGYAVTGPVSFGPIATFVNFNDVEGLNLRLGMETNPNFSEKMRFHGYVARTFKTDPALQAKPIWKWSGSLVYSFNKNYYENPRHYVRIATERESSFPGQELELFSPANFFLSFQRGDATKMVLVDNHELNYVKEYNGFSYHIDLRRKERKPYGSLTFTRENTEGDIETLSDISTSEIGVGFRYAPNEQFLQGKTYRTQLYNEYPIITMNFIQGINIFDNDYKYSKLKINLFKQFEWLQTGTSNVVLEAGKTWGDVPYILKHIPRGNQTYAYQLTSYNMMNFLEFAADQVVSINAEHFFQGFLMNRIPLIKKLKLRSIISFKAVYGTYNDDSNPLINAGEIQFPTFPDGSQSTFLFENKPYMEASLGFSNILKVLRFDIVQRLNYLDHPDLPALFGNKGLGVRVRTLVEF